MTAFGTQPRVCGSRFFPPAMMAVCAFTRDEIAAMPGKRKSAPRLPKMEGKERRRIERNERRRKVAARPPTGEDGRKLMRRPEVWKILTMAASLFGIDVEMMWGPNRSKILFCARRYATVRLRKERGLSYPQIGVILQRDHSTIYNMVHSKKDRGR